MKTNSNGTHCGDHLCYIGKCANMNMRPKQICKYIMTCCFRWLSLTLSPHAVNAQCTLGIYTDFLYITWSVTCRNSMISAGALAWKELELFFLGKYKQRHYYSIDVCLRLFWILWDRKVTKLFSVKEKRRHSMESLFEFRESKYSNNDWIPSQSLSAAFHSPI